MSDEITPEEAREAGCPWPDLEPGDLIQVRSGRLAGKVATVRKISASEVWRWRGKPGEKRPWVCLIEVLFIDEWYEIGSHGRLYRARGWYKPEDLRRIARGPESGGTRIEQTPTGYDRSPTG